MANIPRHITCGTAPVYLFREHRFRFLATGQDTGGTYGAMEIMSPLNTGAGPHVHADAEEHFLLLTGEVAFYVADQSFIVRPGDFLHVPRGVIHHFKVLTPDAKIIATYTPAGEEQAFIHAATPLLPRGSLTQVSWSECTSRGPPSQSPGSADECAVTRYVPRGGSDAPSGGLVSSATR